MLNEISGLIGNSKITSGPAGHKTAQREEPLEGSIKLPAEQTQDGYKRQTIPAGHTASHALRAGALRQAARGNVYSYDRNTEDRRGIKDEVRVSASNGGGYSKVTTVFLSPAEQDM